MRIDEITNAASGASLPVDVFVYNGEKIKLKRLWDYQFLYHGTSSIRLSDIMRDGLRDDVVDRSYQWVDEGGVYLGNSAGRTEMYAQRAAKRFGGDPVILMIDISHLNFDLFDADRDYYRGFKQFHNRFCSRKIRGSENIICDNVDLSLTLLGSVVYTGRIPSQFIQLLDDNK